MLVHGQKRKGGEKGWVCVVITTFLLPIKTNLLEPETWKEGKQSQESKSFSTQWLKP
jgi:hypothetical protein